MSTPRERLHSQTVVLAEHRPLNDASTTDSKATDIAYYHQLCYLLKPSAAFSRSLHKTQLIRGDTFSWRAMTGCTVTPESQFAQRIDSLTSEFRQKNCQLWQVSQSAILSRNGRPGSPKSRHPLATQPDPCFPVQSRFRATGGRLLSASYANRHSLAPKTVRVPRSRDTNRAAQLNTRADPEPDCRQLINHRVLTSRMIVWIRAGGLPACPRSQSPYTLFRTECLPNAQSFSEEITVCFSVCHAGADPKI
jgi:hypothetical protein